MTLVVKLGGAALEDAGLRARCLAAVAALARHHRVAVVHGGGAALTRTLARLGKPSEFIGGLRRTDAETRDAALMVLAGLVNKNLVAGLAAFGQPAFGLCGGDGLLFRARRLAAANGNGRDLGYVGEITASNPEWLRAIWERGAAPVIASLALGEDGEYYNVNADHMAAACAAACRADALVFLTDVPGVWDSRKDLLPRVSTDEIARLTSAGAIQGGMLPKLEACRQALEAGVERVGILPASEAEQLPGWLEEQVAAGTEVVLA